MSDIIREGGLSRLFGRTRFAILSLLYADEQRRYHLREIIRKLRLGQGAVQRELARLTDEGFVTRSKVGNRVFYQAHAARPGFTELKALLEKAGESKKEAERLPAGLCIFRDEAIIAEICRRHHVRRLAVFGSVARGEAAPSSDVDLLVEFEQDHTPGFEFFSLQDELSQALGRKVDLSTPGFLSRYFREDVIREAQDIYAA